jgi:predicted CopG family antitoxin
MSKRYTISINDTTYQRLKHRGQFGESFTDLISRILDFYENNRKRESIVNTGGRTV